MKNAKEQTKGKIIKIKVNRKMQEEINDIREKCMQERKPIVPNYELEAIFK